MVQTLFDWAWNIAFIYFVVVSWRAEKGREAQFGERIAEIEGLRRILSKQLYDMNEALRESRDVIATGYQMTNDWLPRMQDSQMRVDKLIRKAPSASWNRQPRSERPNP